MHIITLTSDWNEYDYYVAALKGKLLSNCPDVRIVDVNHRVKPFNTAQAAFVVRNSYPGFPTDTIHIIAVNSEPEAGGQLLAARMNGHYFLCADNGLLGLLGDPGPDLVVSLEGPPEAGAGSFISLSVFATAACALARGTPFEKLGVPTDLYNRQVPLRPIIEDRTITGSVIYVDSYQNAITNISKELFERIGAGSDFRIYVQSKHYMISRLNRNYNDTPPGELLALFNTVDLLEIAIRNGNAAGLLKLDTNSTIRVEFKK